MTGDRILLFGGTFDPPHRAHVILPSLVADALGCRRIIYIPAARNPLKSDGGASPDEHRVAMLEIAVRKLPNAEISMIEIERGGASYFVETLESLRDACAAALGAAADLRFLIGADQALAFHQWKEWERILELASPAVALRPPWSAARYHAALRDAYDDVEAATWIERIVKTPLLDISATEIRDRVAQRYDTSNLLDPAVAEYIHEHGLYSD